MDLHRIVKMSPDRSFNEKKAFVLYQADFLKYHNPGSNIYSLEMLFLEKLVLCYFFIYICKYD